MDVLTKDEVLYHQGSLLTRDGLIVASWDLEQQDSFSGEYFSLAGHRGILNASASPFHIDYHSEQTVHVINGMGVTLGDSIIGLTAIEALRELNPASRFFIYRPGRAPSYVDQLYHLAAGLVAEMRWLPWRAEDIPRQELCIDAGNQLFWPDFTTMPMIDFFLQALGAKPAQIPAAAKANRWMQKLCLPALPEPWQDRKYVLFCPTASTPLRSIPASAYVPLVNALWERFACPVLGFGAVEHPHYVNIQPLSASTGDFLAWVKHAHYVLTSDTAAVHIAAGYDVPTTAFFTSIAPELRVRDYPLCQTVYFAIPELINVQASARKQDLEQVEQAFNSLILKKLPWA
ncbi:glycosyltransferase family 9 protein [Serratia aquatilis]|uniref:Glycosyltransferase family 9 protein n=1 Tax=Serratia aquatilis TaxID=1737515 RepID=A0ABV6EIM1_9GAMM